MKPEAEIDFKALKTVVAAFNESGLATTKMRTVGVSKMKMAEDLVAAVDALTDEQREQLGAEHADVANFYNDLIADELGDEGEGEEISEGEATEGEENGCPVFGTGWDEASEDCKACMTQFAEEYAECKAAVEAANAELEVIEPEPEPEPEVIEPEPEPEPAPAPPPARGRRGKAAAPATVEAKAEPIAAPPPTTAPARGKRGQRTTPAAEQPATKPGELKPAAAGTLKQHVELSAFGHRMDRMSGVIDKLLLQPQGTTKKAAVAKLVRDFGKSEGACKGKFDIHVAHLIKVKGVQVNKVGEGDAVKYSITQG